MSSLKILALGVAGALIAIALPGVGPASATNLYRYTTPNANDRIAIGTEINLSLLPATSILLQDTAGGINDTCSSSEMRLKLEKDTSSIPASNARGPLSVFSLGGCSHASATLASGTLEIKNIAGTTKGTAISAGARITLKSTIFGVSCILNTGAGTTVGTLTSTESSAGAARFHLNGVVTLENGCGDSSATGTYAVTAPTGLTVEAS